jgi:hypothetical protein
VERNRNTQKLTRPVVSKSCGHLLETTFVLQFFKILNADALASKVEKKVKKEKKNLMLVGRV